MERGPAEMRLDQAIALLKGKPGSIERLGPELVQQARAAAVYADGVRNGAVVTTPLWPTRDAAPPRIQNDHEPPRKGGRKVHIHLHGIRDDNAAERERGDAEGINGAQEADGKVGGVLRQRLSGGVGDWYISLTPDGGVGLYQHVASDNLLDPGKTKPTGDRRSVARDTRRSFSLLSQINRRNQEFWQKQQQG